jgi:5-methyltetrahydrofolate--homocysteine methyltransferase
MKYVRTMSIDALTVIGESINDSVPSTKKLFEANDIAGIIELANFQSGKGAGYIDVNIGLRSPDFMADMVVKIQQTIHKPLSIDSPDMEIVAAGLRAYDQQLAHNEMPILNSISEARTEMFDLYSEQAFIPILLATEGIGDDGNMAMNKTAGQTYQTAKRLVAIARERAGITNNEELIIDPGIAPIASDSDGNFKRLMDTLKMIHEDDDLKGINISVGLRNFTVMLPPRTADGSPVKSSLESAFLTMAMPLGLNMVIGSVKRKYRMLDEDHPAMQCLTEILEMEGFEVIMRLMSYYS